jgi:hypothetical protein
MEGSERTCARTERPSAPASRRPASYDAAVWREFGLAAATSLGTLLYLAALGAPASIEHTGRVLHEVVGSEAKVSRGEGTPAVAICRMGGSEDASNVFDTEADEMEEHLRGLGYLE